jgi:ribosomal protein S18 acetylase RimI-like enzyme
METNQSEKMIIRRFAERDVEDIVDLYEFLKWPISAEAVKSWSKESRYTRVLVAEKDGKVVGKVTLDTAFPPYSELVNLIVHPHFRKVGVASRLVQECIEIAQSNSCSIISLMTDATNYSAHRLYSQFGFHPVILPDPSSRGDLWLFRFFNDSFVGKFVYHHPLSEFSVSPTRVMFHNSLLYKTEWREPLTKDEIVLFLEGQPGQPAKGGIAPRIAGVSFKGKLQALDLLVHQEARFIKTGEEGSFDVLIANKGREDFQIEDIGFMLPKGVQITEKKIPFGKLKIGERETMHFKFKLCPDFEMPILSFATILMTCTLKIRGISTEFMITAGFEHIEN